MALLSFLVGLPMPYFVEMVLLVCMACAVSYIVTMFYFARKHKFSVLGPTFVTPIIGGAAMLSRDPHAFWKRQHRYSRNGYSWQAFLCNFVIFVTRADLCQKLFAASGDNMLSLQYAYPNARLIFGDCSAASNAGAHHKALRASLMNLFTPEALALCIPIQERIIRERLREWVKNYPYGCAAKEMCTHISKMNFCVFQTLFFGEHLQNPEEFKRDYEDITRGISSFPIYFPGTALYKAVCARRKALDALQVAVSRSKACMSFQDAKARCLLDFWVLSLPAILKEYEDKGVEPFLFSSYSAMASIMLDFLFTSEDRTTASLAMLTAIMGERADILGRVREEQVRLCAGDKPLTYNILQEMTFTRQCVLEQLRLFPPAPLVLVKVHTDFVLDDNFFLSKGSFVILSVLNACREGFTDMDVYDPDRMSAERQEDRKLAKQFIPFVFGSHCCTGYSYVVNYLTVYLALAARFTEWKRMHTYKSDQLRYFPSLRPYDCLCTWKSCEDENTGNDAV